MARPLLAAPSVLQANDYTVEITQQPGLEAAVDTMSLGCSHASGAHQRFQTYAAPPRPSPEQEPTPHGPWVCVSPSASWLAQPNKVLPSHQSLKTNPLPNRRV